MAYTKFQTIKKLMSFASIIVLGVWDFISDIIYYYSTHFNTPALANTFMIFLFLSAVIQLISWSSILLKVRFKDDSATYQNELLNADSNLQAWIITVKIKIVTVFKIIWCLFTNFPLILFITFFQKLKFFPMILFGYTYFKYKAVLTTDLMTSLEPIMSSYYKKKSQKQRVEQQEDENTEKRRNATKFDETNIQNQENIKKNFLIQNQLVNDLEEFKQQINSKNRPQIIQIQGQIGLKKQIGLHREEDLNYQNTTQNLPISNSNKNQPDLENQINFDEQKATEGIDSQNNFNDSPQHQSKQSPNNNQIQSQNNLRKSLIQNDQNQKQDKEMIQIELIHTQNILKKQTINMQNQQREKSKDQNDQQLNDKKSVGKKATIVIEGEQKTDNSAYFGINLLIDSNIIPNLQTLLFDKNLQKFQIISDVLEAVFESLPMAVIQYINNTQNQSWFNQDGSANFLLLSVFTSSCVSLFLHCISLINLLYDEDIQIFTRVLEYLDESTNGNDSLPMSQELKQLPSQPANQIILNKTNIDKSKAIKQAAVVPPKKKETNFGQIFPMRAKVEIDCVEQLDKLVRLTDLASKRIKQLIVHLPSNSFSKAEISTNLIQCFSKLTYLNSLSLNLEGNQMKDVLCKPMFRAIFSKLQHLKDLTLYLEQIIFIFYNLQTLMITLKSQGGVKRLLFHIGTHTQAKNE